MLKDDGKNVFLCRFLSLSWHIFKQKKFLIRKQTSLLIDVNILLEVIWIWKISTIFLTFMNILTYETYSKTTQTKNYTSSFKRIFNNFYFSVHSMMGHDEEICLLFLSKFPIEVHQSIRLTYSYSLTKIFIYSICS